MTKDAKPPVVHRRTDLDEGHLRFHHVEGEPPYVVRQTLTFASKSGTLVAEQRGDAPGGWRTIRFVLSVDEADTLAEALAVWRRLQERPGPPAP